jgi:hypothetical protein
MCLKDLLFQNLHVVPLLEIKIYLQYKVALHSASYEKKKKELSAVHLNNYKIILIQKNNYKIMFPN